MKKQLTLFILILLSIPTFSQNLGLTYDSATINNGDTIELSNTDSNYSFSINLWVTNNSNSNIDIMVKKVELSIISGSDNYFCDWIACHSPNDFISSSPLTLASGQTNKAFLGDYNSNGNAGASYIMYTFFNNNDNNDSTSVIVKFEAGAIMNINDGSSKYTLSNAYPNPTSNKFNINYDFSNANKARVEVLNIIGGIVKTQEISTQSKSASIDVSNLINGVYFYNIIVDGRKIESKKLIVQR